MRTFLILITIVTYSQLWAIGGDMLHYNSKKLSKALDKIGMLDINNFEEITLPDSIANEVPGKFFTYNEKLENSPFKYMYIGRVSSCRAGICSVNEDVSEYFDYLILFDANKGVLQVKVFNYQASHGQEITAKSWLKQFIGYKGEKTLEVNKEIDSITGATISTYAITEDISKKTRILNNLNFH